jgi:rfaE bifunctional protein kinase chain/domain
MDFTSLFEQFTKKHVLVVGDVMLDSYLFGKVDRISPEAPVPVVRLEQRSYRLGGAANVALNLKSLGARVSLAGAIGNDENGKRLLDLMINERIGTRGMLLLSNRKTTVKHRVIGNNHQMLRLDEEQTDEMDLADQKRFIDSAKLLIDEADALVFEDYDKGLLNEDIIKVLTNYAISKGIPTIVDPKERNFSFYKNVSLFKPNLKEIKEGLKLTLQDVDEESLKKAADQIIEKLQCHQVLITLSEQGVFIYNGKESHLIPAHFRNIADVSGAGDTVVSVATLCMACDCDMITTAFLSNLAGGLVCEMVGVVPVNKNVLLEEALKIG